jgi:hypothetical protein
LSCLSVFMTWPASPKQEEVSQARAWCQQQYLLWPSFKRITYHFCSVLLVTQLVPIDMQRPPRAWMPAGRTTGSGLGGQCHTSHGQIRQLCVSPLSLQDAALSQPFSNSSFSSPNAGPLPPVAPIVLYPGCDFPINRHMCR